MWRLHKGIARAKANTTGEPNAGKPHVRDCAGAPGNGCSYRESSKVNGVFSYVI
jgi:hypothetical protein